MHWTTLWDTHRQTINSEVEQLNLFLLNNYLQDTLLGVFVQLRILIAMSSRSDSWSDSSKGLHRDLQYLYLEPCLARPPRAHEPTQPRLGEAAELQSEVRPAHLATRVRWRWGQQKIPRLPANGNAGTDASWDIWRREYYPPLILTSG